MKPKPEREQEDTARAAEATEATDEADTASEEETLAGAAPEPDDCYQPRVTD
jgi:hypothetical protein